jgi:hypothetical protein
MSRTTDSDSQSFKLCPPSSNIGSSEGLTLITMRLEVVRPRTEAVSPAPV